MGSAHVLVRVRGVDGQWRAPGAGERGPRRYIVRWRFAGRDSRLRHGGSFGTRREAELRRRYLLDEIAAGRMPDLNPGLAIERAPTVEQVIADQIAARVDVSAGTRENYASDRARVPAEIRAMRPGELSRAILQGWVNRAAVEASYGPAALRRSVLLLRAALGRAGVDPNPAEGLSLPTYHAPEIRPPSAAELIVLVASLPENWRPIVCLIEGSGLRANEAERLLARDVDRKRGRLRVQRRRTKGRTAGERFVPLRPATLALVPAPRTRHADEPVLHFVAGSLRKIMHERAESNGWSPVTPKALRHRYASRLVAQGLPITLVRERLGHSRASMTLDTYAHVLLDEDQDPALDLADLLT